MWVKVYKRNGLKIACFAGFCHLLGEYAYAYTCMLLSFVLSGMKTGLWTFALCRKGKALVTNYWHINSFYLVIFLCVYYELHHYSERGKLYKHTITQSYDAVWGYKCILRITQYFLHEMIVMWHI